MGSDNIAALHDTLSPFMWKPKKCWCITQCDGVAGIMSDKSMSELVGNFHRPSELGSGQVLLATRGPGEFAGMPCIHDEALDLSQNMNR